MREETVKIYKYDELSNTAKAKAREWYCQGALDYNWWEFVYETFDYLGIKITSFDLGNSKGITGRTLSQVSLYDVAKNIVKEYAEGPLREIADEYLEAWGINEDSADDVNFKHMVLQEALAMLQREHDYLLSEEQVEESIRANEYEFTVDGKRW